MRFLILFFAIACSSTPQIFIRGDLKDLVLKPRTGHEDYLTNQTCAEYEKGTSKCIKWDLVKFHLLDDSVRARLRALKFQCNINGERFRICEKSRGFCQQRIEKGGLFSRDKIVLIKYLSGVKDYQFLIDSKMWCAAQDSEEGKRMFKTKPKGI